MAKSKSRKLPSANSGSRRVDQVYLVQPPIGGGLEDIAPPLGIMAMAKVLEEEGCQAHLVDLNLMCKNGQIDPNRNLRTQFVKSLPKRSSLIDLLGITTWSYNFDVTMEYVQAVKKKHPHMPIVLGGPHVTFVDVETMETFSEVDFVIRDEGDYSFPRLIHALRGGEKPSDLEAIPGLTWRRGTDVVRNPSGAVVEDMDALPYPAYELIDVREYLSFQTILMIEAGRGCPYNCNFCSTTNMFKRSYRVKSAKRLVDEIEWLMAHSGSNNFELLHDNLVASKKYVKSLCKEIRERNIDVTWHCTSRTDNLTEEVAEEMFLAGCDSIFFGVESMSEERQKWTGKKLKPPLVREAIELTARQHIRPNFGIIVGFPDESESEFDITLETAIRWTCDPKIKAEVSTAVLRYYPGADLFANANLLEFDPIAAADSAAIPGYLLRPEWRDKTNLFPLQSIHTDPEETRRNILRRNFIRSYLKLCPMTLLGCLEILGYTPRALLDRLSEGRDWEQLDQGRIIKLIRNESIKALGDLLREAENEPVLEMLSCEVPFWETTPMVDLLDDLEHVIKPKRFDQDQLLAHLRGERKETPDVVEGQSLLAIRAGPEAVVWFTDKPDQVLQAFQQSYKEDRKGTIAFVQGLRRGV